MERSAPKAPVPWPHAKEALVKTTTLLLLMSASAVACSNQPAAPVPGGAAAAQAADVSTATCPAQRFEPFLHLFAAGERIRERYTAPFVVVTDWRTVDEPTEGTVEIKVPRNEYRGFTLTSRNGRFHNVAADGTVDPDPVAVAVNQEGPDYEVRYTYGMSEGNSWRFAPHEGCWRLVSDPEPSSL
jgi:hypothetical protein